MVQHLNKFVSIFQGLLSAELACPHEIYVQMVFTSLFLAGCRHGSDSFLVGTEAADERVQRVLVRLLQNGTLLRQLSFAEDCPVRTSFAH